MKTKDMVALLQYLDPEGETDLTIGNNAVVSILKMPAFQEGCLERINMDPDTGEYIGAELCTESDKISIMPLSIQDALIMNPELPIKFDIHSNKLLKHYIEQVGFWRETGLMLNTSFKEQMQKFDQ